MKKIGEIDYDLRLPKKSLSLCRPNKVTIGKINEAYDINYNTKTSTIHEISFKIPVFLVKDGVPTVNPNIEKIKNRYIFKLIIGEVEEYFLFHEQNKVYGDDDYIEYHAYSLGVQLGDKHVREYEMIGNLKEVGDAILDEMYGDKDNLIVKRWRIGYVDSYFVSSNFAKRDYKVSSMTGLETIYDMANKWNAIVDWDTTNLKINFYRPENFGSNKGFKLTIGKLMEGFDLNINSANTVTRLRAFGHNNMTFNKLNPLGQDYIEDFSLYMYPFEYDKENNVVIQSSEHMSDNLCIAITKYNDLVASMQGNFEIILKKIETIQESLAIERQRLSTITTDRIVIEDERDILLSEFQPDRYQWGTGIWNNSGTREGTPAHHDVIARLNAKKEEERLQQTNVENIEFQLRDAEAEKKAHLDSLSPTLHYTQEEWEELQPFIITKEYTNDSITDEQDLLDEAKVAFEQMRRPKLTLSVNIIDLLSVVECQNDWDKLNRGDDIRVKHEDLRVDIMAKIVEINYDLEGLEISLTIANEVDNGDSKVMEILNNADLTTSIVGLDKENWNLSKENNGLINQVINNKWDSLKNAVVAGYDQMIEISERGIIVKSLEDPNSWLVIQNGFLAITNDEGDSWKHAISKDGIWGEYIFGKVISGVNLIIEDESGIWKTQGSRTTIYNRDRVERMRLGLVSDNEVDGLGNIIPQDNECFGLVSWNDHTKVEVTDCVGVAISRWKNSEWEKVFWANTDGTLYTKDMVAERIKIVNNVGDVILDAENDYFNIGILQNIVADGKLTTIEKMNLVTELYKVHADYKNVLQQAEKYNKSSRDIVYDMNAQWSQLSGFPIDHVNVVDHCNPSALIKAYTDLMNYMSQYLPITNMGISTSSTLVIDMNLVDATGQKIIERTDTVADRGKFIQVFRDYDDESGKLKRKIEDSLFYSGINMGNYYNNIMIGEQGFVAVRNDGRYRAYLNATNGLALEKWESNRWVKKLYGAIGDPMWEDGTLIAEGLVTKNLRIVDAHMNQKILFDWYDGITILGDGANIHLNANDAIRITDKFGDSKFWVDMNGFLYAKDITTHNLSIVDGDLGERIVFDHQDGISIFGDNADIFLNANDAIRIMTKSGEHRFWVDTDGFMFAKKLYIMGDDDAMIEDIDGSYISALTVNSLKTLGVGGGQQDIVFIKDNFIRFNTNDGGSEITKMEITYNGTGATSYPIMTFGSTQDQQARIYKDDKRFAIEYDVPVAQTKFYFNNTDTDDEGQAVYFSSSGGVRFHSDNKFVAKTADNKYIRIVQDDGARMQFGDNKTVLIDNEKLRIQYGESGRIEIGATGIKMNVGSNSIEITTSGIKINGTRVDIN